MKYCDLHSHSNFSDGSNTPAEIISQAKALGIAVALTDHNTVGGLSEFVAEAQRQGACAVAGTELSTMCGGVELHLLGLFIEPEYYTKVEFLVKEFLLLKEISNLELTERLNDAGYDIDYSEIKKNTRTDYVNRAHFAAELMKKGYVESISDAFKTILSEDAGFYVPPPRLDFYDAIEFLREINALPVLAHPLQELSGEELRAILPRAKEAGLVGMEVYHSSYSDEQIAEAFEIAETFSLAKSGGSDYHGENKPDIFLGVGKGNLKIPIDFYENLKEIKENL